MSEVTDKGLAVEPDYSRDRYDIASQWQLTWWAFKKHRLAIIGLWVVGLMYIVSIFCEFTAPNDP